LGEGLRDYEDLFEGFKPMTNVIAALFPVDLVLNKDP
jgi:hypothetical protein